MGSGVLLDVLNLAGFLSPVGLLASCIFCHDGTKRLCERGVPTGARAETGEGAGLPGSTGPFAGAAAPMLDGILMEVRVVEARRNSLANSCTLS
jgi:hypothetical protein